MKTVRCYLKAFLQIMRFEPLMLPLTLLAAVCRGIRPFINVYFSARIVAQLYAGASSEALFTSVGLCIGLNFLFQLLTEWFNLALQVSRTRLSQKERLAIENKLFTLDYAKLEDSTFQELVHLHSESMDKIYSAFSQLAWMVNDFISGTVTLTLSVVILLPLFKLGFTKTGEGFVHSPWFFAMLVAAIGVSAVCTVLLTNYTSKVWFQSQYRYGKLDRLFHRYRDILSNYNSGKEVRLYKEQSLISN